MSKASIDEVVSEEAFAGLLQEQGAMLFRLGNSLNGRAEAPWTRVDFFQLVSEADTVESFLDDHGAQHNRSFCLFRDLVASLRGFAGAGFSLSHLEARVGTYGLELHLYPEKEADCLASIGAARRFVQSTIRTLLAALREEAVGLRIEVPKGGFPREDYRRDTSRRRLPRNVGQEAIEDEEQRIAEVASKFLVVCEMFQRVSVRRIAEDRAREALLSQVCSEERARVYEATVHNLQSAYDTYIKNTVLEKDDPRLPRLRGHISAAFHLLEAVTSLVHFVERHEGGDRRDSSRRRIDELVSRSEVRDVTLNLLLYWAAQFLELGKPLAEELLPAYTNVQELEVEIDGDLVIHARPAALIVGIVNHHGTPVEMEVEGDRCNAGSILDLMVTVGSNSNARLFRFRGDENPLRDIGLLFEHGLGENGISSLPDALSYLADS